MAAERAMPQGFAARGLVLLFEAHKFKAFGIGGLARESALQGGKCMGEKRRTKVTLRQKRALGIALLTLALVVAGLVLFIPAFGGWLEEVMGIRPVLGPPRTAAETGATRVHFIDVGQGDAVLLEESGQFALVDAGPGSGADALLAYLKGAGVARLEYVFMSHPHEDHIGGMQAVLEQWPVGRVILPDFALAPLPTTRVFEDLLKTMDKLGIKAEQAVTGGEYSLGNGRVHVLQAGIKTPDNLNLLSVALRFNAPGLRFFTAGDAEKANETAMLEEGAEVAANLYKASHHGSSTSNSAAFVQAMAPQLVVVTCGQNNTYGHPHDKPMAAFAEVGAEVLRTDQLGSVLVWPRADGGLAWAA